MRALALIGLRLKDQRRGQRELKARRDDGREEAGDENFFIFGLTMITFIVFIILFTTAFGRLFCGWVCPQTVFMEFIFRPIEWLIEGSPNAQRRLKEESWTRSKILKKSLKHALYLLISFAIAHTFHPRLPQCSPTSST